VPICCDGKQLLETVHVVLQTCMVMNNNSYSILVVVLLPLSCPFPCLFRGNTAGNTNSFGATRNVRNQTSCVTSCVTEKMSGQTTNAMLRSDPVHNGSQDL
jgi:hypothetical protein